MKHNDDRKEISSCVIDDIFILMGGESLKKVDKISAGNVVGIGGLDDYLFNMGTLSNDVQCPSFA